MNSEAEPVERPAGPARPAALIFTLLASLYLITTTSRFRLDDEHILAARTQSLALWGEATQSQVQGNSRVEALEAQGDQATQLEPLLSFVGSWIYRGARSAGVGGAQALFVLNPILTAATAVTVFLTVVVLGFSRRVAIWCALLFGAGSLAWPYATTFLRDTLAMALAAMAFLGIALLVRNPSSHRIPATLLIAFGLVGGALAKNTIVAVALGLGLVALLTALVRFRSSVGARWTVAAVSGVGLAFLALLAILPGSGPLARYSLGYYTFLAGHFLTSLKPSLLVDALGPFVSPAKSVFLFSPPLLLAIPGLASVDPRAKRVAPYALVTAAALTVAQALFYREQWAGAVGWGLRFMLPAIPPLVVLGAPAVERMLGSAHRWPKRLLVGLLIAGMGVQIAGSVVDWGRAYSPWLSQGLDPFATGTAWKVRFLALPAQIAGIVDPSAWSLLWPRLAAEGAPIVWGIPLVATLLLGASLLAIGRLQAQGLHPWRPAVVAAMVAASLILPAFPTLVASAKDPAFGGDRREFDDALLLWHAEGRGSDQILVDSYGTPLWAYLMNGWNSEARWTSLPYEIPGSSDGLVLSPSTRAILEEAEGRQGRIWYITSEESPDFALQRETRWLDAHDRLLFDAQFAGATRVVVRVYCNCGP